MLFIYEACQLAKLARLRVLHCTPPSAALHPTPKWTIGSMNQPDGLCVKVERSEAIEKRSRMLRSAIKAVAIALIACSVASAQEAQKWEGKPRTKLEAFLETSGAVIIRGRTEIGTLGAKDAARVLAVTLRNASTAEEAKGIVIEVSQTSAGSRSAAKSYVDYDEIAGLIQAISS